MGLDILAADAAARDVFEMAASILGRDVRDAIGGDEAAELDRTDVCQPAILVTSLAVVAALRRRELLRDDRVGAAAGLSLGEYTALAFAGAMSVEDAVKLVALRGQAMQRASDERKSGMLSLIGATPESAAALCDQARGDGVLVVANLLAKGQVAIAGTTDALDRCAPLLEEHRIRKAIPLPVAGAFHSPCMESAAATLADALDATRLTAPSLDVVMNVTARPTRDPDEIRDLLKRQITSPVLWQASMETLLRSGATTFLEPAPSRQLTNMVKKSGAEATVVTCATADELQSFSPWPETPS